MAPRKPPAPRSPLPAVILETLRRRPLIRSIAYGVGMNAIGFAAPSVLNSTEDQAWSMAYVLAVHSLAAPFMAGLTYSFIKLCAEDADWWDQMLRRDVGHYLVRGVMLGTTVYLIQTGVAASFAWVRFPAPGWHAASKSDIARTLITHLGNLCVAWNEEMLYRGYGLYSLSSAIGLPAAIAILVPSFAWGHASGWQPFLGQSTLGLATTALVLANRSLWLPIGYHAAWNYLQTAVLGPPDAAPSLLPMHIHGPELWMGRPGYPEPGLLATLANLIVAAAALFIWRRNRRKPALPI